MRYTHWFCIASALVWLGCVATAVDAATVYRCVGKDGVVAFQDHACSSGSKQGVLDIVSHDPPVSVVAVTIEKPAPVVETARPAPVVRKHWHKRRVKTKTKLLRRR